MDVFGFLVGISPWVWIALGLTLAGAELLIGSFFLLWPGLAALLTGLALAVWPGMGGTQQAALFAGLAAALTAAARFWNIRHRGEQPSENPALNRRQARMVGRRGRVLEPFGGGEGVVEVDGLRWRARLAPGAAAGADAAVRVREVDGVVLVVEPEG